MRSINTLSVTLIAIKLVVQLVTANLTQLYPISGQLDLTKDQTLEELNSQQDLSPERVASLADFAFKEGYEFSFKSAGSTFGALKLKQFNEMSPDKCRNLKSSASDCSKLKDQKKFLNYCHSALEKAADYCADLYANKKIRVQSMGEWASLYALWAAVEKKKNSGVSVVDNFLGKGLF